MALAEQKEKEAEDANNPMKVTTMLLHKFAVSSLSLGSNSLDFDQFSMSNFLTVLELIKWKGVVFVKQIILESATRA